MQIGLIAPSSIPFVWGGAENLYAGLQTFINSETRHACEIIKVPTAENDFPALLASYRTCLHADVAHFDALVSTKYPSWMAQNDRHVCYMLHKLRGLYDTYHFMREPVELSEVSRAIKVKVSNFERALTKGDVSPSRVDAFIQGMLDTIAQGATDPQFRFPGPLSRKVIHLLDNWSLHPNRISHFAAISRNIAERKDYFPDRQRISVLHPPPRMSGYRCGSDDYFFTMSRLDSPKRIDILVSAVRGMTHRVPFIIAGTGPEEARLQEIADGDPLIKFVGKVDDQQAIALYADALAVPFIPYDEDYGYITVEAMLSGKPVITTNDAGGPLEFVSHGQTGLVCDPTIEALTAQLDYAAAHRMEMRDLGRAGRIRVSGISWKTVVDALIEPLEKMARPTFVPAPTMRPRAASAREKIVVVVTFTAYPPRGGGQTRVYNLYKSLSEAFDVELVCLCGKDEEPESIELLPGLIQTKVPVSPAQFEAEIEMSRTVDWVPVTDIAAIDGAAKTPAFGQAVKAASIGARAIVLCHPFLYRCVNELGLNLPIWYEAQDVEFTLKKQMLPESPAAEVLLDAVRDVERQCWDGAEVAFTCSNTDIAGLEALYGKRASPTCTVPNGVDPALSPFVHPGDRSLLKAALGLHLGSSALFVGSWHEPNIQAARFIIDLASKLPTIEFLIVGSVCLAIQEDPLPPNVKLLGVIDDEVKALVSNVCDIALNPMTMGTGSNLKMFDYFSAGIPVITTEFGARGIESDNNAQSYITSPLDNFSFEIVKLLANMPLRAELSENARKLVNKNYTWSTIAEKFTQFLCNHVTY